jgi:hypothetical protein
MIAPLNYKYIQIPVIFYALEEDNIKMDLEIGYELDS